MQDYGHLDAYNLLRQLRKRSSKGTTKLAEEKCAVFLHYLHLN